MTTTAMSPNIKCHIKRLKEIFNTPHSKATHVFSTPGYLDFLCADSRIEGGVEEKNLNTRELKVLVLHFLQRRFFEPVFIVKNGKLAALMGSKRNQQARDEIRLFPEYAWVPENFPGVRKDFLDLERQLNVVRRECLEKINFLDGLLDQLKNSDAIIWLACDDFLTEENNRNNKGYGVWKIIVCRFVE